MTEEELRQKDREALGKLVLGIMGILMASGLLTYCGNTF